MLQMKPATLATNIGGSFVPFFAIECFSDSENSFFIQLTLQIHHFSRGNLNKVLIAKMFGVAKGTPLLH